LVKVLVTCSKKGGVGKSLTVRSLAVAGLLDDRPVMIIDADPQGTVTAWAQRRPHELPYVLPLGTTKLPAVIKGFEKRGGGAVIIDTPPSTHPILNVAIECATGCLIVTEPLPESIEQVGATAAIVENLKKPGAILLNRAQPRSAALAMARSVLTAFPFPVCPTPLTQLVDHPYAAAEGLTASERSPNGKAASEISQVYRWLVEKELL
jgi:chromosome partitioning protein